MMSVALATGLYATHVMVPPTPGPIAAAANLGLSDQLLWVIIVGMIVSVPSILIGYVWAKKVASKFKCADDVSEENAEDYEALLQKFGKLPSGFVSFMPIVLPILLMAIGSVVSMAKWGGMLANWCMFLGTPVIALFCGFLSSLVLLPQWNKETLNDWVADALKSGGNIIIITAAGGALGRVLANTGIGAYLGNLLATNLSIGILVPFIVSAAIKTAQGSSTVALTVTSAIMFPLLGSLGLNSLFAQVLTVMAIGAGSMTVSHANDSYFWVITEFSGMEVKDSYRSWTLATLVQGIGTMAVIWVLSLFA
jgi:GntP family gluconate:H+ symporter